MMQLAKTRLALLGLALCIATGSVVAQETRDPTVAPAQVTGSAAPSPIGSEGMTVIKRDDKSYLVVGTRLYAVGDQLGQRRIERISETEVWLKEGTSTIKVPRFNAIERNVVVPKPRCDSVAPVAPVVKPHRVVQRARNSNTAAAPKATASKPVRRNTQARSTAKASKPAPVVVPCEDTLP